MDARFERNAFNHVLLLLRNLRFRFSHSVPWSVRQLLGSSNSFSANLSRQRQRLRCRRLKKPAERINECQNSNGGYRQRENQRCRYLLKRSGGGVDMLSKRDKECYNIWHVQQAIRRGNIHRRLTLARLSRPGIPPLYNFITDSKNIRRLFDAWRTVLCGMGR